MNTTTKAAHTRTQWYAVKARTLIHIRTGGRLEAGYCVASIPITHENDAAHIVKCVNAHEGLVKALEAALNALQTGHAATRNLGNELVANQDIKGTLRADIRESLHGHADDMQKQITDGFAALAAAR